MTKTLRGNTQVSSLIVQLLEKPNLIHSIQNLDAPTFSKILQHVGLEDSAEILSLATTQQIQNLFDEDLWSSKISGKTDDFNAEQFATWLEVLCEISPAFAAEKLTEMDEEFFILGLSSLILVLDLDELSNQMNQDEEDSDFSHYEWIEKALDSHLSHEIDNYLLLSKNARAWDSILNVLTTLDQENSHFLQRALDRCLSISAELIKEEDGLYSVLSNEEIFQSDASAHREDRRLKKGYVSSADARAFLRLITNSTIDELQNETETDHITKMYFRHFKPTTENNLNPDKELISILLRFGIIENPNNQPLLATAPSEDELKEQLMTLKENHPELYSQRMLELNYLANILISGSLNGKQKFRPLEAANEVLRLCNIGLRYLKEKNQLLPETPVIRLFKIGFRAQKN